MKLRYYCFFLLLLVISGSFIFGQQVSAQEKKFRHAQNPGFYGLPLKYIRTMNYEQSYPTRPAIYIYRVEEESRVFKAGLESGNMIERIDGQKVQTMADVREVLLNRESDSVPFKILRLSPRVQHRIEKNPFYTPSGPGNYTTRELTADFSPKKPPKIPTLEGKDQRLYHRHGLAHSPNPKKTRQFKNPVEAENENLEPCPICFPEREQSTFQLLVEEQLGGTSELVSRLKKEHKTIKDVPDHIRSIAVRLFRQRLRRDMKPEMLMLDTDRFHGFGVPNGTLILSRGLNHLMESDVEVAAQVAHQMAHMDLKHDHSPVQKARFQDLLTEAVERTTGVSFSLDDLKDLSPSLPGFGIYREILEKGYGKTQEREAAFLAMVYLYRSGFPMNGVEDILEKREDMQDDVHPIWIEYLLKHPIPSSFRQDISEWKKRIPEEFERNLAP